MRGLRFTSVISTPPSETRLTTLETIMDELDIQESGTYDLLLQRKIDEATSDIEVHIPRKLALCGLTETIWDASGYGCAEFFQLRRAPVAAITSVTVDGTTLDAADYRVDKETGVLYRRASGGASQWTWSNDAVIVYQGGFVMPGSGDYDAGDPFSLPPALQAAAIELVSSYWASRGRDPTIMEEETPGVSRFRYWVGAVGAAGELPPSVMAKILPFRRLSLA